MGNCIIRENKAMQTGWEISKHKEPMKVDRASPEVFPVVQHTGMVGGQMYFPVIEAESEGDNGVVRIKLVISKRELEVILRKGGVSMGDLVSHTKKESCDDDDEDNRNCGRWKPDLDSIPES